MPEFDPREQIRQALSRRATPVAPRALTSIRPRQLRYVPPDQRQRDAAVKGLPMKIRMDDDTSPRGLFEQFGDSLTNVIKGAGSLAVTGAKTALEPIARPVRLLAGDLTNADVEDLFTPSTTVGGPNREALGFQRQVIDSNKNTVGRLAHPSRYLDAINEGRIVDVLLEDVGNLSLVAGGIGKGLGVGSRSAAAAGNVARAEQLGKYASRAERFAKLGGQTSDLPISVPRKGLQALGAGAKTGVEALGRTERFGPTISALKQRASMLLTEEGRVARGIARDTVRTAGRDRTAIRRRLLGAVQANDLDLTGQGVLTAVRTGIGDVYKRMIDDGMDAETARQTITLRDIPEQTFTPDVAAATLAYLDGTMDPALRDRIDTYGETVSDVIGTQTQRALAGTGRVSGPMDQRYLGSDVIPESVEQAVTDAGYTMTNVPGDVLGQILDSPEVYPKAWRPKMRASLLANEAGVGLPVRPDAMLDAGMKQPDYLPGGPSQLVTPTGIGTGRQPLNEGLRGLRSMGSEKFSATNEIQPFSARTIAEKAGDEAFVSRMNEGVKRLVEHESVGTVAKVLDPQLIDELRLVAEREAKAQRGTAQQIKARADQFHGEAILAELDARGYEVLPGDLLDPVEGAFDPAASVAPAQVTANSVILPKGLKAKLVPYMVGKDLSPVLSLLAKANSKWKGWVLPFSVRWQLGDALGGMYMGAVGGGIPPWQMIDGMRQIKNLDADAVANVLDDPRFQDAGLNFQEMEQYRAGDPDVKPPRTPIGKFQRGSYKLNAAINRVNRQGYVLAKLQKLLDERGLDVDMTQPGQAWDAPEVQKAITDAVNDANRVMGTFDEMTPFERRVVKQVFPFWLWNRHITQLAWRTAIDHPARMMWTMRLGSLVADPDEDLPSWLKGSVGLGGQLWPTNFVNPFNDVAGGSIYTPEGAARSLSPGIKLAAFAGFGKDANRGFADVTRPYGSGRADELGRASFTPGILRPLELAYMAARQFPQGRAALDLAPTGEVGGVGFGPHPRYGQGSLMLNKSGQPMDTTSRALTVARTFGLPVPTPRADVEQIMAAADKRRLVALRRRENQPRYSS